MADWLITITSNGGPTQFSPDPLNITLGDTVRWGYRTDQDHQIAIQGVTFTDVLHPTDSSDLFTPQSKGPIPYNCTIHTAETGTINVAVLALCMLLAGARC